jgi:hypothetical protein
MVSLARDASVSFPNDLTRRDGSIGVGALVLPKSRHSFEPISSHETSADLKQAESH